MLTRSVVRRALSTHPLHTPFPGLAFSATEAAGTTSGKAQVTHLKDQNILVVTQPSLAHYAGVAAVAPCGPRLESATRGVSDIGSAQILSKLLPATDSVNGTTALGMTRKAESLGAGPIGASVGKEYVLLQAGTHGKAAADLAGLLSGAAFGAEITSGKDFEAAKAQAAASGKPAEEAVIDLAIEAAFDAETLGSPSNSPADIIASRTAEEVAAFYTRVRGAAPGVIAVAGSEDHDAIVAAVEASTPGFTPSSSDAGAAGATAEFTGGRESHVLSPTGGVAHVAVSFASSSCGSEDLFATSVLAAVLGGGASFSEGGPGKGIYTHLYTEVLCKHAWALAARAHPMPFRDSGAFVLSGAAPSACATELVESLTGCAAEFAKGAISDDALARGKAMLTAHVLQMYDGEHAAETLALDAFYGHTRSAEEVVAKIEGTSKDDVVKVAKAIFASQPAVATISEGVSVPSPDAIAKTIRG